MRRAAFWFTHVDGSAAEPLVVVRPGLGTGVFEHGGPMDPAADHFLSAYRAPVEMPSALSRLAEANGGDGAVLLFSHHDVAIQAIASAGLSDHLAEYVAGQRPSDPRTHRVLPSILEGFRLDQDDFTPHELKSDPFYQDFLKPRGLGWHACALLNASESGETIHLSLKRKWDRGPFSQEELTRLTASLPVIRSSVRFTQASAALIERISRSIQTIGRRGIFGLDARG